MTEKETIEIKTLRDLDRRSEEMIDCCGTCDHAVWIPRGRYRACDLWNIKLVYAEREKLTKLRCAAHVFSEDGNAVALRINLTMRDATLADPSKSIAVAVADVPLSEAAAPPPKPLADTRRVARVSDQELRERERRRIRLQWEHEFATWDGS